MVISKTISIIIPCRNEKNFIGMCLDSIIANDFPKDSVEVFVVDGISEDGTRDIIMDYAQKYPFIRLLDNPEKVTPVAMNRGIKEANGDYIMVLSSHSKVNNNFIKANVESLEENTADCVGGILVTLPANDNLLAQTIAFVLSNPFGVGNSYFRKIRDSAGFPAELWMAPSPDMKIIQGETTDDWINHYEWGERYGTPQTYVPEDILDFKMPGP